MSDLEYLLFTNEKSCQPCIRLKEYLTANHPTFTYEKVNPFEDERALTYQVRSTPTLVTLKDGVIVDKVVGYNNGTKDSIEAIVFKQLKM